MEQDLHPATLRPPQGASCFFSSLWVCQGLSFAKCLLSTYHTLGTVRTGYNNGKKQFWVVPCRTQSLVEEVCNETIIEKCNNNICHERERTELRQLSVVALILQGVEFEEESRRSRLLGVAE